MSSAVPSCETIQVVLFRGDRSGAFGARIKRELDEQKNGLGPGPAALDCLLLTGHTGVSTDGGTTTYGFKPDASGIPLWELMERLKSGDSFPGIVTDDRAVFSAAATHGLVVKSFKVLLHGPRFQDFRGRLDGERQASQYTYGYPNVSDRPSRLFSAQQETVQRSPGWDWIFTCMVAEMRASGCSILSI